MVQLGIVEPFWNWNGIELAEIWLIQIFPIRLFIPNWTFRTNSD
jgi:hypothetical protein